MNQVPFPHFLQMPKQRNNYFFRIVTDKRVYVGDILELDPFNKWNDEKKKWEMITHGYKCEGITVERPAQGNWANWPVHPTYYELKTSPELYKTVIEL